MPLLEGVGDAPSVYFVHSYHAVADDPADVAAEADYPDPFPALVWRDNLMAAQFHPEKSQRVGLAMYANFAGASDGPSSAKADRCPPRPSGPCGAPGRARVQAGSRFAEDLVKIMQVIPAIDLRGGHCVRLQQGDYSQETVFGDDPAAMAAHWAAEGAGRIHLVDLDGAKEGRPVNVEAVRSILARRRRSPASSAGGSATRRRSPPGSTPGSSG